MVDLDAIVKNTTSIMYPENGKDAEDNYRDKEIHVSYLVKETAYTAARRILNEFHQKESDEGVHNYWGGRGGAVSWWLGEDADKLEITFRRPVRNGWSAVGTVDYAWTGDAKLALGEAKYHNAPTEDREVEWARRQNVLELAMWWLSYQEGQRRFEASPYFYDEVKAREARMSRLLGVEPRPVPDGCLDLVLPDGVEAEGSLVRIAASRPELCVGRGWRYTIEDLTETWEYYEEKADCISEAVDSEDLSIASRFDQRNVTEFTRKIDEWDNPPIETLLLLAQLKEGRHMKKKWVGTQTKPGLLEQTMNECKIAWAMGGIKEGMYTMDEDTKLYAFVSEPKMNGKTGRRNLMPDIRFVGGDGEY